MGSNDTAEALAVCHEVNVANEARIAELQNELGAAYVARTVYAEQVAELERELTQATTALADRLRTDAHGIAAVEADLTSARHRLAAIARLVHPLAAGDDEPLTVGIIRRILDEVTAEPWGVHLTLDDARLAERACRHSAASIRAVHEIDPDRLHPDVLPYADRLDTLADRLAR